MEWKNRKKRNGRNDADEGTEGRKEGRNEVKRERESGKTQVEGQKIGMFNSCRSNILSWGGGGDTRCNGNPLLCTPLERSLPEQKWQMKLRNIMTNTAVGVVITVMVVVLVAAVVAVVLAAVMTAAAIVSVVAVAENLQENWLQVVMLRWWW